MENNQEKKIRERRRREKEREVKETKKEIDILSLEGGWEEREKRGDDRG